MPCRDALLLKLMFRSNKMLESKEMKYGLLDEEKVRPAQHYAVGPHRLGELASADPQC